MSKKDGGPAFPRSSFNLPLGGMSLRDYFAGQALKGMHARDAFDPGLDTPEKRAKAALIDADAMLKAREDGS